MRRRRTERAHRSWAVLVSAVMVLGLALVVHSPAEAAPGPADGLDITVTETHTTDEATLTPNDPVTFAVSVENNENIQITIDSVVDDQAPGAICDGPGGGPGGNDLTGVLLEAGAIRTCTYTLTKYAPAVGEPRTNNVTVDVSDATGSAGTATVSDTITTGADLATATVTLQKVTDGNDQPEGSTGFTFTVACDSGTEIPSVTITPDDDVVTLDTDFADGDFCTITETDDQGAASTSYTVNDELRSDTATLDFEVTEGDTAIVVTNTFACADGQVPDDLGGCVTPESSITLEKVTVGINQPAGDTVFRFTVDCGSGSETVTITPDEGEVLVAIGVDVGDVCTIRETDDRGATSTSYTVNGSLDSNTRKQVVTVTEVDTEVVVTNTFACPVGQVPDDLGGCVTTNGSVRLEKITAGNNRPAGNTEFTFTVECESGAEISPVTVTPDEGVVTVATGVVLGDDCIITETGDRGATSTSYTVNGGPGSNTATQVVTVTEADRSLTAVATNTYRQHHEQVVVGLEDACPDIDGVQSSGTECEVRQSSALLPGTGAQVAGLVLVGMLLTGVGLVAHRVAAQPKGNRGRAAERPSAQRHRVRRLRRP